MLGVEFPNPRPTISPDNFKFAMVLFTASLGVRFGHLFTKLTGAPSRFESYGFTIVYYGD
jgi:hypothetical protein